MYVNDRLFIGFITFNAVILIACLTQNVSSDPTTTTCVQETQRRVTADCTHTEIKMYLRGKGFSIQLKADSNTVIPSTLGITLSLGKCDLQAKAYSTPDKNVVSIGNGKIISAVISIKANQKNIELYQGESNAKIYEESCVPDYQFDSTRYIVQFVWDANTTDKGVYVQFDSSVDFNLPTTTVKSTTKDSPFKDFPVWAAVLVGIVSFILLICFIVLIGLCIYAFCCRNRRKKTEKVDVGVPATDFCYCSEFQGSLMDRNSSVRGSHLSVVSDFSQNDPEGLREWPPTPTQRQTLAQFGQTQMGDPPQRPGRYDQQGPDSFYGPGTSGFSDTTVIEGGHRNTMV